MERSVLIACGKKDVLLPVERSVLIACGNKDVLLPVERGVLNSLWKEKCTFACKKKDGTFACGESST